MKKIIAFFKNWKRQFKVAVYDPSTFDEVLGFTSSTVRILSMLVLLFLLIGFLSVLLVVKTPLKSYFLGEDNIKYKEELAEQMVSIDSLRTLVDNRDHYIENIKAIILGKVTDEKLDSISEAPAIDPSSIEVELSSEEALISEKVKDDQRTNKAKPTTLVNFIAPVKGKISQGFKSQGHPAIDVVTSVDKSILACLSGTVIYSSYSPKDGNTLIIAHTNGFLSVYKHAKSRLKQVGDKVSTGDPIAIVGNTGENTTGPHLHFELWQNQKAIDPTQFISFEK